MVCCRKRKKKLVTVAHARNPSCWGGSDEEIQRMSVQDQPRQKVHETPISINKSWMCQTIPATGEAQIGGSRFKPT
jgi:hypothetical protein